jgi:hypothetical protein
MYNVVSAVFIFKKPVRLTWIYDLHVFGLYKYSAYIHVVMFYSVPKILL